MSAESTILISVSLVLFILFLYLSDTLRVFKDVQKQKLYTHEKITVVVFCIATLGFGIFGYSHFHEKDFRQSFREFKKFSLYRDFLVCHTMIFCLVVATEPAWLWRCLHDSAFFLTLYFVLTSFSFFVAILSYLAQLPNFFDRHQTIFDESHR